MKYQLLTTLTVLLTLNAGLFSTSRATESQGLPPVTPTQSSPLSSSTPPESPDQATQNATGLSETQGLTSQAPASASAKPISRTYAHKYAGRQAVTVYVKDIPVVTFLGAKSTLEASVVKVAVSSTKTANIAGQVSEVQAAARTSSDPILQATTLTSQLNQLHASGFDPKLIRVSWQPQTRSYVINADKDVLLTLGNQTLLPTSTGNATQDALKMTNLLRRQMGNAPALTSILGKPQPKVASQLVASGSIQFQIRGEASWYGPGFHGGRTANGESFNQYAMTAAHRSLPFGTQVRVTNLNNGRSVLVRINDRGPFTGGRVIDLSKGAASVIGVTSSGVAPVRIDVLR